MDESPKPATTDAPPEEERMLLDYLADRDVACPLCEYNLRGLTTPRCPECGRELTLSVGLAEPYLRAWVLLALAVFGSSGVGLLFWLLTIARGWPPGSTAVHLLIICFMASPLAAIVITRRRRRFLRWQPHNQWIFAWVVIGLTLSGFIMFMLGRL